MKSVRINRLNIHFKGISYDMAQATVRDLGNRLMTELTNQSQLLKRKPSFRVDEVDVEALRIKKHMRISDLQKKITSRIVDEIWSCKSVRNERRIE